MWTGCDESIVGDGVTEIWVGGVETRVCVGEGDVGLKSFCFFRCTEDDCATFFSQRYFCTCNNTEINLNLLGEAKT